MALLEGCDITNNGRHLDRHLGFYQELEIRLKPWELVIFFVPFLYIYTQISIFLATRLTFIVERSWKNIYFHPKMAWAPATYDVISRNHSNWLVLNLSQNVHEDELTATENVRCWYLPPGKNSEKPLGGEGVGIHPSIICIPPFLFCWFWVRRPNDGLRYS